MWQSNNNTAPNTRTQPEHRAEQSVPYMKIPNITQLRVNGFRGAYFHIFVTVFPLLRLPCGFLEVVTRNPEFWNMMQELNNNRSFSIYQLLGFTAQFICHHVPDSHLSREQVLRTCWKRFEFARPGLSIRTGLQSWQTWFPSTFHVKHTNVRNRIYLNSHRMLVRSTV